MSNVSISYQDMQQQATKLRSEQQEIESRLRSLQQEVQSLVSVGFVTDTASGQFSAAYDNFSRGATQTLDALEGMATYLDRAAQAFESVDSDLARAIS
ncbi:MAG TPA: WXG100 family type VII secretion target [Marmoricola sp.]|nr:WXG100 family type VII secretion target [Marmoricola sp.]